MSRSGRHLTVSPALICEHGHTLYAEPRLTHELSDLARDPTGSGL
jgi:hypothetical protein